MTLIIVTMETILTIINPFFDKNEWKCYKKENSVCYRNPKDEFVISLVPKTGEIKVTVPLNEVVYMNKFYNIDTAVDYVKMHLIYYGGQPPHPH